MNRSRIIIIFVALFYYLFLGCKKDDGLTPATQTGKHTFSCKVNGSIFMPKQELFGPKPLVVYVSTSNGESSLYLSANGSRGLIRDMSFHIDDFKGVGTYYFQQPVQKVSSTGAVLIYLPEVYVHCTLPYPSSKDLYATAGAITITRYDSGVMSGFFEYTVANGSDVLKITKGRFDLRL